ncbi:MAG: IclR family transcriptional regulator [Pseudomonadota bacterium]
MYLERILIILEAVSKAGSSKPMTVAEIAAATNVPKPSVYRQVGDLVESGLLEPQGNGRYTLGPRARRLSDPRLLQDQVKERATPLLKTAAQQHGVAFFLSRLSGASVDIIHAEVPQNGVSYLHPGIGGRPLHACSCGKALAAFSEDQALSQALSGRLRAYTDHTKTENSDVLAELHSIRRKGYAECVEELEHGICSVAAPLHLNDRPAQYSIGATGTLRVFQPDFRAELGGILVALCQELSQLLLDLDRQETRHFG